MKKIHFLIALIISSLAFSQAPQSMSYQAVIRDTDDNLITNQMIGIQISIIEVGVGGTIAYVETQTPTTNANGLITIEIGTGNIQAGVFAAINWAGANYEIKSEVDVTGGSNYTITGTSQLLSVPYAFYAVSSGGNTSVLKDADGDTQIQVEESPNENIIRFDMAGTEKWVMKNNALEQLNSGGSLFIGQDAGANDDLTDNKNVFLGFGSGFSNTSGNQNIAVGHNALVSNTTGTDNTAMGYQSLYSNTIGNNNTSFGSNSMFSNTEGNDNVAIGTNALFENTAGNDNIAVGNNSLNTNTNGVQNIAIGNNTLFENTIGIKNIAIGHYALSEGAENSNNIAIGFQVLKNNFNGTRNTALGNDVLRDNTSGSDNVAIGDASMLLNVTGSDNVSIGAGSLLKSNGNNNTAIGSDALGNLISGVNNTAIGINSLGLLINGSNNIGIGNSANVPDSNGSNQIRIGNTDIVYAGVQVAWTVTSDRRWKDQIRTLPYGLDFVKQLKPVDYIRKNNIDKTREIGFIAQDIEALLAKVGYDDQGILHKDDQGMLSLRYNDFIPVLAKAIQEQQEIIEQQQNKIVELSASASKVDDLQSQIDVLKEMVLTNQ